MVAARVLFRTTAYAALLLACACGSDDAPSTTPAEAPSARRGRGATSNLDLDLKGMLPPVPQYEGQGRNLFAYGPRRRATPPRPPTPTSTTPRNAVVRPTTTIPRSTPVRPGGARVDVKYAGFVEKTETTGEKAKYAIFLDGNEILAGAEGETVANRFTVVEIGLESVTVSAEGSSATQRIPLQTN